MSGKVWLVGAGPGDPELITRKGLRLIRSAEVIVFDRLLPLELLDEARPDAIFVNVGKAPARQRLSQAHINETLIQHQTRRAGRSSQGRRPFRLRARRRGSAGLPCGGRRL